MNAKEIRANSIDYNRIKYVDELNAIYKKIDKTSNRGNHFTIYFLSDKLDKWDSKKIREILKEDGYKARKGIGWDTLYIEW